MSEPVEDNTIAVPEEKILKFSRVFDRANINNEEEREELLMAAFALALSCLLCRTLDKMEMKHQ